MSKLEECIDTISPACDLARSSFDVRLVLVALGAQLANTAAVALAAGVDPKFIESLLASVTKNTYEPLEKKPIVKYVCDDEVLGRKH